MISAYTVSSECISTIIHRLSLSLGDFEGFLYGTHHSFSSNQLKDDGSYVTHSLTTIHNVFIFTSQRILSNNAQVQENFNQIPKGMLIIGWVAGRREVPLMPSIADRSTHTYLLSLAEKFPNLISADLIFGLFITKSAQNETVSEIEKGKSATAVNFEYKFLKPKENFVSLKVQIENLNDTKTEYNKNRSAYEYCAGERIQSVVSLMPTALMEECRKCVGEIESLIPDVRRQQLELESAMLKNLLLRAQLYHG